MNCKYPYPNTEPFENEEQFKVQVRAYFPNVEFHTTSQWGIEKCTCRIKGRRLTFWRNETPFGNALSFSDGSPEYPIPDEIGLVNLLKFWNDPPFKNLGY